ncbi:aspartate aminotransferase family protein [Actinopolyspora mortivallis]|uniref:aspartate aminotransferase family protein n=1 Tax=Actinopolyspora mortivallis TaxID=33906 RepID=UPI00036489DE|nr:aminotransferase class III-fold pyridoxal phosphate-dependent enzyme [Actinopolyspora mortivallis]
MTTANDIGTRVLDEYESRTPGSLAAFRKAHEYLPGGDTRTMTSYDPHPLYFDEGQGVRLRDVDGNWYTDFLANYGALVHGHNHPALLEAVHERVELGTAPGGPTLSQIEHARRLCERVPSLDTVRYCNSGTEATMWALRAARAFTGRDLVVKISGGYHGTHDWSQVDAFVANGRQFPQHDPELAPATVSHGVPGQVLDSVLSVPYNDVGTARRVLSEWAERTAAVIVEPMLGVGGGIPADPGFLHGLREVTERTGALLIFDECATFRVGPWQVRHDVRPDLTTFSKIIGGGLPIGVFGGRADVMEIFDPNGPDPVFHASAFGANSLSLAAGIAALDNLGPADIERLNRMGERFRSGLDRVAADAGVAGDAVGCGSISYFHFGFGEIHDAADVAARRAHRADLRRLLHLELLNRGFVTGRHGIMCLSVPTEPSDVDEFTDAFGGALRTLRPHIARHHPELLDRAPGGTS